MIKKNSKLEAKVDLILKKMDQRFESLDQKIGTLDQTLNKKIDDLASVVADLNCKTNDRIDYLAFHIQEEFRVVNEKLDSKLDRKEFIQWVHKYDGSLKEIKDARQNRLLFENQFVDLDDKVAHHEDRIKKLEQAIPNK